MNFPVEEIASRMEGQQPGAGAASPKQLLWLKKLGMPVPPGCTADQATQLILQTKLICFYIWKLGHQEWGMEISGKDALKVLPELLNDPVLTKTIIARIDRYMGLIFQSEAEAEAPPLPVDATYRIVRVRIRERFKLGRLTPHPFSPPPTPPPPPKPIPAPIPKDALTSSSPVQMEPISASPVPVPEIEKPPVQAPSPPPVPLVPLPTVVSLPALPEKPVPTFLGKPPLEIEIKVRPLSLVAQEAPQELVQVDVQIPQGPLSPPAMVVKQVVVEGQREPTSVLPSKSIPPPILRPQPVVSVSRTGASPVLPGKAGEPGQGVIVPELAKKTAVQRPSLLISTSASASPLPSAAKAPPAASMGDLSSGKADPGKAEPQLGHGLLVGPSTAVTHPSVPKEAALGKASVLAKPVRPPIFKDRVVQVTPVTPVTPVTSPAPRPFRPPAQTVGNELEALERLNRDVAPQFFVGKDLSPWERDHKRWFVWAGLAAGLLLLAGGFSWGFGYWPFQEVLPTSVAAIPSSETPSPRPKKKRRTVTEEGKRREGETGKDEKGSPLPVVPIPPGPPAVGPGEVSPPVPPPDPSPLPVPNPVPIPDSPQPPDPNQPPLPPPFPGPEVQPIPVIQPVEPPPPPPPPPNPEADKFPAVVWNEYVLPEGKTLSAVYQQIEEAAAKHGLALWKSEAEVKEQAGIPGGKTIGWTVSWKGKGNWERVQPVWTVEPGKTALAPFNPDAVRFVQLFREMIPKDDRF